jgi:hypothetical protein
MSTVFYMQELYNKLTKDIKALRSWTNRLVGHFTALALMMAAEQISATLVSTHL